MERELAVCEKLALRQFAHAHPDGCDRQSVKMRNASDTTRGSGIASVDEPFHIAHGLL